MVAGAALLVGLMAYFPIAAATSGAPEPLAPPVDAPVERAVESSGSGAGSPDALASSVVRLLEAAGSATQVSQTDLEDAGLPSSIARLLIERDIVLAIPDQGAG